MLSEGELVVSLEELIEPTPDLTGGVMSRALPTGGGAPRPKPSSASRWAAERKFAQDKAERLREHATNPPPPPALPKLSGAHAPAAASPFVPPAGPKTSHSTPSLTMTSAKMRPVGGGLGGPMSRPSSGKSYVGTTRPTSAASTWSTRTTGDGPVAAFATRTPAFRKPPGGGGGAAYIGVYSGGHAGGGKRGAEGGRPAPMHASTIDLELRATERLVSGVQRELVNERVAFSEQRLGSQLALEATKEEVDYAVKLARTWEERATAAEGKLAQLEEQAAAAARRDEIRIAARLAGKRKALQAEVRKSNTDGVAEGLLQLAEQKLQGTEANLALAKLAASEEERSQLRGQVGALNAGLEEMVATHAKALEEAVSDTQASERATAADHIEELQREHAARMREMAEALEHQSAVQKRVLQEEKDRVVAQEKTRRIGAFRHKAARRLANAKIVGAWTTWREVSAHGAARDRRLRASAARLSRPKLAAATAHWRNSWEAHRQTQVAEQLMGAANDVESLEAQLRGLRDELQATRAEAARSVGVLRDQIAVLTGDKKEVEEQLTRRLDSERDARVQHLCDLGMRRFVNARVSKAFDSWSEGHRVFARQRALMRNAAGRLARPQLTACVAHWKDCYLLELERHATMSINERLAEEKSARAAAEDALVVLKRQMDAMQEELMAKSMLADEARSMQGELEREREARVAGLAQMALRRLVQAGLAAAFTQWADTCAEHNYQKQLMQNSLNRLSKPHLAACIAQWRASWSEEMEHHAAMSSAEQLAAAEVRRLAVVDERNQLRDELAEAKRVLEQHEASEEERLAQMAVQLSAARDERIAQVSRSALRRIMQQGLARGWEAWSRQYVDARHEERTRRQAIGRMMRRDLVGCIQV